MTEKFDDKLDRAARELATEISPKRDLWPGIAEAIATPKRSRWTPILAQAAAIVLLVGIGSTIEFELTHGKNGSWIRIDPPIDQVEMMGRLMDKQPTTIFLFPMPATEIIRAMTGIQNP